MTTVREPSPPFPEQHLEGTGAESELRPKPRYEAAAYRAASKLEGKAAIVTGGDSGIGRAVAVLYAREGADVVIVYQSHDQDAEETRHAVEAEGRQCWPMRGDIGDPIFCKRVVREALERFGKVDIVVSNAAVQTSVGEIEELTPEQVERTFRTNVFGYIYLVQAAAPHMPPGSAVIATGSETGIFGSARLPDYSATKGAIHALTKSFAERLVARGIRVNCVAPGPVWTPLNPADEGFAAEQVAEFGQKTRMGRPAQPEEIAPAYVFFASAADSSFVTGQVLAELGGASK